MNNIKIIYHDKDMPKLEFINGKSDWIDLRAKNGGLFKKGDFALIDLGISIELPPNYEAYIVPRSSTFKKHGIIQTNSIGIIDNSYCGTDDVWKMPCYFTKDTTIEKYERICQFRIMKKMGDINFEEVEKLNNKNRGGFGSSGV